MEDTLFSTTPVAPNSEAGSPVVVVGLPRSGSSYLSHVLSQFPNYYVFDDLYLMDQAKVVGVKERISPEQMKLLLFFLGWQIRARLRFGSYSIPAVSEDEVERMNIALAETFDGCEPTVLELQEEWLTRLAHRSGARNWGFKMPKAFREIDRLRAHSPEMKVIYLMRQPHDVLVSYKHIPKTSGDGDPARYHPVAYAYYWHLAAQSFLKLQTQDPEGVLFVNFGDLTGDTEFTVRRIAGFLGELPPEQINKPERSNSSHDARDKRKSLTGLEVWITNWLCGKQMAALGFERRSAKVRPSDFLDLLHTTWRMLRFHLWDTPLNRRRRTKVARAGTAES